VAIGGPLMSRLASALVLQCDYGSDAGTGQHATVAGDSAAP
jgi:hypothetical protein